MEELSNIHWFPLCRRLHNLRLPHRVRPRQEEARAVPALGRVGWAED